MTEKKELTLANRITILRLLFIPPFLIALLERHYSVALLLGAVMGISDGVDGLIARRFKQKTRLGSFLDPLADKLLLLSAYAALVRTGDIPDWVLVVVLSKDLVVSLGWGLIFILRHSTRVATRFSGKAATTSQMAFAGLILVARSWGLSGGIWPGLLSFFQGTTVALTGLCLIDYLYTGTKRLAQEGQG